MLAKQTQTDQLGLEKYIGTFANRDSGTERWPWSVTNTAISVL